MEKLNVLAIGAHPDDAEIYAGGTIAKYAKNGHRITICIITDGTCGTNVITPEKEIIDLRRKESENACKIIGASLIRLEIKDQLLPYDIPMRIKVIDVIRKVKPDLVLTHYPDDAAPDHRNTGRLVFDAIEECGVVNLRTEYPAVEAAPAVFFWQAAPQVPFNPDALVDITETLSIKKKMFGAHKSQVKFLSSDKGKRKGADMISWIDTVARYRGFQLGVEYAEGFRMPERVDKFKYLKLLP